MRRIPIKPEHILRVLEFRERVMAFGLAQEEADSRLEYEKTLKARKEVEKEFWDYFRPRYKLQGPAYSLIETKSGELFIYEGTEVGIENQKNKSVYLGPTPLAPPGA